MGRDTGPVCRQCRREGAKLFLKGARCYTKKCSFEKRPTPPGMHMMRRRKVGDYGLQLREKQKMRRVYRIGETQFRRLFEAAERGTDVTGEKVQELDRSSEGFIIQSFDLRGQENMRNSWGLFRDRRPDLYRNLTTLDGEPE